MNKKFPDETIFYRDLSIFGLKGIDQISCDSARKLKTFFFFAYYRDSLDLIAIKSIYNKKNHYIQRVRSSNKPLYITTQLYPNDPTERNIDNIVIANDSTFIIHRSVKSRSTDYPIANHYYIWDKKSDGHILFSYYTLKGGQQLDLNNYANNGGLIYEINYKIENGFLLSERTNHAILPHGTTKKKAQFESMYDQIFLDSL